MQVDACVYTQANAEKSSGEGKQSSGEFCMLGAHTETSWWINKGVLASDCANFLTFGIINDFSLPLGGKKKKKASSSCIFLRHKQSI